MNSKKSVLKWSFMMAMVVGAVSAVGASEGTAYAGSASANMEVSATVSNTCIISAAPMSFGTYDAVVNASAPLETSANLTITCTQDASAAIAIDQGLHQNTGSSVAVPLRRLTDGTNHLSYTLYQNALRTTVWGGTGATASYTGTGSSTAVTVYGRVASGQNVPAGSYADTVQATITF